jgi:DNA-binding NarL/FixJ family response regulator
VDGLVLVPVDAAPRDDPGITHRRAEVAEGLSNEQIGTRLLISGHTVDSHVRNILNKLGFGSRAQVAARLPSAGR